MLREFFDLPVDQPALEKLPATSFEKSYIALRKQEHRVYSKEEIVKLPVIAKAHPHYKEWRTREKSFAKILRWPAFKKQNVSILEIGCGNGWLSNALASNLRCEVTGLDVNREELKQATRIFSKSNLHFKYGHIEENILQGKKFDLVLLASSIQYFSSVESLVRACMRCLDEKGEIHIIDSNIYESKKIAEARDASEKYYQKIGFPEMSAFYFHHTWEDFTSFKHVVLQYSNVNQFQIFKKKNVFPWVVIYK